MKTWKGKRGTKVTLAKPSQPRLSLLLLGCILRLGKFSTIAFPSPAKQNGQRIFLYIYTHNSTMTFAGLLAKVWVWIRFQNHTNQTWLRRSPGWRKYVHQMTNEMTAWSLSKAWLFSAVPWNCHFPPEGRASLLFRKWYDAIYKYAGLCCSLWGAQ